MAIGDWFWRKDRLALDEQEAELVRRFHEFFYSAWKRGGGTLDISWMGHRIVKTPLDLWIYQEILAELRPSIVIETGTRFGGSAMFFAHMLDLIGEGRVISIDNDPEASRPPHPRIEYLVGASTSAAVVADLEAAIAPEDRVMVTLDSDHSRANVLAELRLYQRFVTPGQYLVCEDTNLNGNPIRPDFGPGPAEALAEFLRETEAFEVDRSRERFLISMFPGGFLRRK